MVVGGEPAQVVDQGMSGLDPDEGRADEFVVLPTEQTIARVLGCLDEQQIRVDPGTEAPAQNLVAEAVGEQGSAL